MSLESEPGQGTRVTVRFPESGVLPGDGTRGRPCMTADWTRDLDEAGVVRLADLLALKIRTGDVVACAARSVPARPRWRGR